MTGDRSFRQLTPGRGLDWSANAVLANIADISAIRAATITNEMKRFIPHLLPHTTMMLAFRYISVNGYLQN